MMNNNLVRGICAGNVLMVSLFEVSVAEERIYSAEQLYTRSEGVCRVGMSRGICVQLHVHALLS